MDLDRARDILKEPIVVTSGYRCESHNTEVGGVSGSTHTKGMAVDILCPSPGYRGKLIAALITMGFTHIGLGQDFVHVDDRPTDEGSLVLWLY